MEFYLFSCLIVLVGVGMLTYLPDELRSLAVDRPPARSVRKSLFTLHLWKPARCRQSGGKSPPQLPVDRDPTVSTQRSADRGMSLGWLNAQSLRNKAVAVCETIDEQSLDVLSVTETWHTDSADIALRLAAPDGYAVVDVPRQTGRHGGGVAIIYRKQFKCSLVEMPPCRTMELIAARLTTSRDSVIVVNVYRPGSERPSALFFEELSMVLETVVLNACSVVVGGDLNVHVQDDGDVNARRFNELIASFDMMQHVRGPTHRAGHTLDVVLTFSACQPQAVTVAPAGILSDHSLVTCRLLETVHASTSVERFVRGWRKVDRVKLRRLLENSDLCRPANANHGVDQLFDTYESVLRSLADQLAPSHAIRRRLKHLAPWFDADCRAMRRNCRRLERRYRRTQSPDDRWLWVDATRKRFQAYRVKRDEYWLGQLQQCGKSSRQLWRSLSSVLGRDRDVSGTTGLSANQFAAFFTRKIDAVRESTEGLQEPSVQQSTQSSFTSFRLCTPADVRRLIMKSPVKSCSQDPVPTFLVREFVDVLLPYLTDMVNACLTRGHVPVSQKHAVVSPLIKKVGLDTSDPSNYRPVSNLTFMSKVVERAVAEQLHEYLTVYKLLPRNQSAYRKFHSTETALLRVWSDILMAADCRHVTLLSLIDLSAAFDCVDHGILLRRLEITFGLKDTVLRWVSSYLSDRTQQIAYSGQLSAVQSVLYGVPQGSVLGPLLYVLYTAELHQLVQRHGVNMHQYADDCQLYLSSPVPQAAAAVSKLSECLSDVNDWLSCSRLRLNASKTQVIWMGSSQQLDKIDIWDIPILSTLVPVSHTVRDLGVIFDGRLTMAEQVSAVCRSGYYQLRQMRSVARSLSEDGAKAVVNAFISCRLDYCNSLLSGVSDCLVQRLQSVQNAAARFVTGTRRCEHITPVLRRLHWLPVRERIRYKLLALVHRALSGQAPEYLVDDCQLVSDSGRRPLRSAERSFCLVPRCNSTFGDRSFAVAGPRLWNSLPTAIRNISLTIHTFGKHLKTHFFSS